MSAAAVVFLGITLPLWGGSRAELESAGFRYLSEDTSGLGMKRVDTSPEFGIVEVLAALRGGHLDAFLLQTKCSPEQLANAVKTVTYCKERKGEYRCEPKEPTNPFVARVCGRSIMLWKEGDPETLRQVNMGCQLAQSMYKEAQEAKPDTGTRP